jgi:hypothetical protein
MTVDKNDWNEQGQTETFQPDEAQPQQWKSRLIIFGVLFALMSACGYCLLAVGMVPGGLGIHASKTLLFISYATLLDVSSFVTLFFPVGAVIALLAAYGMHKTNRHAKANILLYTLIAVSLINFLMIIFLLYIPRNFSGV